MFFYPFKKGGINLIFITGGVRSGKSAFAEQLAAKIGAEKHCYYVATGMAFDEEMKKRILRHQLDRKEQEMNWTTTEMQVEVPKQLKHLSTKDVVLFECVTTWLSNVLYYTEQAEDREHAINSHIESFKQQLLYWKARGVNVIIVSNEVLDEPASTYAEVNLYRKVLGHLHQWIVYNSKEAYEVQFQLVQQWK